MKKHHTVFAVAAMALVSLAQALPIVVRLEDLVPSNSFGNGSGAEVEDLSPGYGSAGVVGLDWNPDNNFQTSLRKWHSTDWANWYPNTPAALYDTYSGRAGAYCTAGATASCGLEMGVQSGYSVSLDSFFLGSYITPPQTTDPFDALAHTRTIAFSVIDLADNSVVASGAPLVTLLGLVVNVNASSTAGFRINFGPNGFDGAINDITYRFDRVSASVPEPGTLALGLLALAAGGFGCRRQPARGAPE